MSKIPAFTKMGASWGPLGLDGPYRYRLFREWAFGDGTCVFIMLNPSTATDLVLDPTVRRCVGYAYQWGFQRLEVVNLFAFRSPFPDAMKAHPDPVGPENDAAILDACRAAALVMAAWGNDGAHRDRDQHVRALLKTAGVAVHALHVTGEGQPGHPLYLPKGAKLRQLPL